MLGGDSPWGWDAGTNPCEHQAPGTIGPVSEVPSSAALHSTHQLSFHRSSPCVPTQLQQLTSRDRGIAQATSQPVLMAPPCGMVRCSVATHQPNVKLHLMEDWLKTTSSRTREALKSNCHKPCIHGHASHGGGGGGAGVPTRSIHILELGSGCTVGNWSQEETHRETVRGTRIDLAAVWLTGTQPRETPFLSPSRPTDAHPHQATRHRRRGQRITLKHNRHMPSTQRKF